VKVLVVHNHYQQRGGEDEAFRAEADLLEAHGHDVVRYSVHNDSIPRVPALTVAIDTVWSAGARRDIARILRRERPDVMHVHNTFPLLSPSIYFAARSAGVPVVQTLHNYRLLCPNALLFRDGHVCEDCLGRAIPFPGVVHACYRNSRAASAVAAAMLAVHNAMATWKRVIDLFIALTDFARDKFVAGGLPADRVFVKPNFVSPDPGIGSRDGGYFLFVGRLSAEKGIDTLLSAWRQSGLAAVAQLRIIGDGPLAGNVRTRATADAAAVYLGTQSRERVLAEMRGALCLVFPTMWYEGFPFVIAEAFATGLPVISANIGAAAAIVAPGRTGLHFTPGDSGDLAARLKWAAEHRDTMHEMGGNARRVFEKELTPDRNYELLMTAYDRALAGSPR